MTTIEKNQIIHHIKKGVGSVISIKGLDWSLFEARCQVKRENRIDAPAVLEISPEVQGEHLLIKLSGEDTLKLSANRMYFDIKLMMDGEVVEPVISGEIRVKETVTNVWN